MNKKGNTRKKEEVTEIFNEKKIETNKDLLNITLETDIKENPEVFNQDINSINPDNNETATILVDGQSANDQHNEEVIEQHNEEVNEQNNKQENDQANTTKAKPKRISRKNQTKIISDNSTIIKKPRNSKKQNNNNINEDEVPTKGKKKTISKDLKEPVRKLSRNKKDTQSADNTTLESKPTKSTRRSKLNDTKLTKPKKILIDIDNDNDNENENENDNEKKIRSFKVKLPGKDNFEGRFTGLTPYQAANKALSKYFRETENPQPEITFSICESTRKSKKAIYTYNGKRIKLEVPVTYQIKDGRQIIKNYKNSLKKVKKDEANQLLNISNVQAINVD